MSITVKEYLTDKSDEFLIRIIEAMDRISSGKASTCDIELFESLFVQLGYGPTQLVQMLIFAGEVSRVALSRGIKIPL